MNIAQYYPIYINLDTQFYMCLCVHRDEGMLINKLKVVT